MKDNNDLRSKFSSYIALTSVFIIISILSVLFLFKQFDETNILLSIRPLPVLAYALIFIVLGVYLVFDALRFYYILKALDITLPFKYIFKITLINEFISNITPFGIGGGISQVYFLNKDKVSLGDATAATTIKSVIPALLFFLATPIAVIVNNSYYSMIPAKSYLHYVAILVFTYGIICYLFYRFINDTNFIKKLIYNFLSFLEARCLIQSNRQSSMYTAAEKELDKFAASFKLFIRGSRTNVFYSILFTALFFISLFFIPVILLRSYGYSTPLLQVLAMQTILAFIIFFAPTPGSSGIAEGGFTVLFSKYVTGQDIFTLTFLWRFFSMYLIMVLGMITFYIEFRIKKTDRKEKLL